MAIQSKTLFLGSILFILTVRTTTANPLYEDCDDAAYYAALSATPTRQEIGVLLKSTHRNSLPYTSSTSEDVWDALIDLDVGSTADSVRLIYKQTDQPATPHGTSDTWNREHMWPKSHGVGDGGKDYVDIHHLRPSDWNVNSARNNKYFGECGLVRDVSECTSPAHVEAEATTETDPEVWLPPSNVRGDIARAMFYMEHRYYGDGTEPNLELTDCPTDVSDTKLAYLSQLLQWHMDDPVDADELARNNRACERWQGNRNIFVDKAELVQAIYGLPQTSNAPNGYASCSGSGPNTPAPVAAPTPSSTATCSGLVAGDVQVVGVHSDNPDEIALVALEDLPAGLALYMTDNGWMGSEFRNTEGTVSVSDISGNSFQYVNKTSPFVHLCS